MKPLNALYNTSYRHMCVIIGNGPSLNAVPKELLAKYPTFGTNRIYLRLTPSFYVSVNPLFLKQRADEVAAVPCPKFLPAQFAGPEDYVLNSMSTPMFSYDPSSWIYEGHTVTFVCMQLAFFMGFTTVLLVGVDHFYTFDGQPNQQLLMTGDDPNHFDPNYFRGMDWNAPDLTRSEEAYMMAKKAFEDDGRRIINLVPVTEGLLEHPLKIFPLATFEEYL